MSEGNAAGEPSAPGGPRPLLSGARGLIGRRPAPPLTPGRLPSIRSRDLTLGGVKKKTFTPNIISRKIKEEPKEEVTIKKVHGKVQAPIHGGRRTDCHSCSRALSSLRCSV
uniref:RNA polymerase III subunit D n=1 Tax=Rousettus aegyptiacus TaxID=9407 RepID=A0A7J8BTP6_ROUAE|nr:RNA polymerase III subunit D [Rousettus aegyptiacus]